MTKSLSKNDVTYNPLHNINNIRQSFSKYSDYIVGENLLT